MSNEVKALKNRFIATLVHVFFVWCAAVGCVTDGTTEDNEPQGEAPQITKDMPLREALEAAISYGGKTLNDTKDLITRRNEWKPANKMLGDAIGQGITGYSNSRLINAAHLYQQSSAHLDIVLFDKLISSGRPLARQLGWQLAANMPSAQVAKAMDEEMTRAINEGDEPALLVPEMANAVQANRLSSAYTLMRQGLMTGGDEAFAKAMISLDPRKASEDFLGYMALAPVEELRQLTQKSVNLYACLVILRHMTKYPPSPNNPNFDQLFIYSVSRNSAFSDLANLVIETSMPQNKGAMASVLSKLPTWIQVAYINNLQSHMTPAAGMFMGEMRRVSSQAEVLEELDQSNR